jgi:N-acetyl-alpha-D-muramate 1-phosphate uridylyltransferase
MILAAGRGERMRPLTDVTPKPLLRAGGRPLIEYHIAALVAAGVTEIVVNVAWLGDAIRTAVGDGSRFGAKIYYSDEGDHALETGGGIFRALPLLGRDPFVVVSADIWCRFPWESLLRGLPQADLGHLVLVPNPEFHRSGDFSLEGDRVRPLAVESFTYGNIGVFSTELFAGCTGGAFKLAPLLFAAAERGRLSGELFNGEWHNIGSPAQLATLDQQLQDMGI